MGLNIFVPNDIQPEVCVISKYREAIVEHADDPSFAEFLSRELVGPQVEVHLCCSTWSYLLERMGLSNKYKVEGGSIDVDELELGIRICNHRLGGHSDRWIPIIQNIVNRARQLGENRVVWG